MSDACKYTRERCAVDGKAIFRSKDEAEKEAKRLRRYKFQFRGMKAYRGEVCHVWHLGDGGDHGYHKAGREKIARRKEEWL